MDNYGNRTPVTFILLSVFYIFTGIAIIAGTLVFLYEFSQLGDLDFYNYLTDTKTYKLYVYTAFFSYQLTLTAFIFITGIGILRNRKWAVKSALSASWNFIIFSVTILIIGIGCLLYCHEILDRLIKADEINIVFTIMLIFLFLIVFLFIIAVPLLSLFILSEKSSFSEAAYDDRISVFLQDHSAASLMPLLVCMKSAFSMAVILPFDWLPLPFAGSYNTGLPRAVILVIFLILNILSVVFMIRKNIAGWVLGFMSTMGYIFLSASVFYGNPSQVFLEYLESGKTYLNDAASVSSAYISLLPDSFFMYIAAIFSISYIIIFSVSFKEYFSRYPQKHQQEH